MPLSLTDQQLDHVMAAARPLQQYERGAFLQAVASYFTGRSEIGDGELFRAMRELQREHFNPPRPEGVIRHNGSR